MQANRVDPANALVSLCHIVECVIRDTAPRRPQLRRNQRVLQQPIARVDAEGLPVDGRPLRKWFKRTHRMDAPEKTPEPFEHVLVVEIRRASAVAGKHREAKAGVVMQGLTVIKRNRRHHRNFTLEQLGDELVLFENLRITPAPRAVKLGDHRWPVVEADLIDAIFVGVQRQQATITGEASVFHRVKHGIGGEAGVGWRIGFGEIIRMRRRVAPTKGFHCAAGD